MWLGSKDYIEDTKGGRNIELVLELYGSELKWIKFYKNKDLKKSN